MRIMCYINSKIIFLILREETMVEVTWGEVEVVQEATGSVVTVIQTSMGVGIDDKAALCKIRSKLHSPFHLPNAEL